MDDCLRDENFPLISSSCSKLYSQRNYESGASLCSAKLFACNVCAGPNDLIEHKGAKITPSQRMDNTSRGRGERMNLTHLSFASATPSKTYIIIVRLNRHHQNYPVQTLQTLAPTTPHMNPFLLKKQEEEVQPSHNSQYMIMMPAQRRLNGLTHSSFQCVSVALPSSPSQLYGRVMGIQGNLHIPSW